MTSRLLKKKIEYQSSWTDGDKSVALWITCKSMIDAEKTKNEIETNDKLIHHILNCPTCIETGLNECNELADLKGVYDKIPFLLTEYSNGDSQ